MRTTLLLIIALALVALSATSSSTLVNQESVGDTVERNATDRSMIIAVLRCLLGLALIFSGACVAYMAFFSCTFEPMIVTGSCLVGPSEEWLRKNTTLEDWRPREEFATCNFEFCREGTLLLPFYEITFVHGVDDPNDLAHMHLENTEGKARQGRMAVGTGVAVLFEIVIAWTVWVLLRRPKKSVNTAVEEH